MKVFSLVSLLLTLTLTASAQTPQTKSANDPNTIRVNVDLVDVRFTVADQKGHLLTNLKQSDFQIFEDNKLQTVNHFGSENDLPLTIGLVIDSSASIRDQLEFEQEASAEFFYDMLRRGTDHAFVVGFDSAVDLRQDMTDDPELLATAVRKIKSGGGTSLYDAIALSSSEKLAKAGGRRVLIVISDGDDNSSNATLEKALEEAQKDNVTIYTISTNSLRYFGSKDQERGDDTLKKLATETGGRPIYPQKLDDLHASFVQITDELRHQYTISYLPKNTKLDGTFRKIRIEVDNVNCKVNARKGYYASAQPRPVTATKPEDR